MRAVGIKVLKNKLSEYLRLAKAGERILVTDRDEVVAELRAPQALGAHVSDAVLAELVRSGMITPPRSPLAPLPEPVALGAVSLVDDLRRDREQRE